MTPFAVKHAENPPVLAVSHRAEGRTICYSGDTEGRHADRGRARRRSFCLRMLHVRQGRARESSLSTLREKLPLIGAKRTVLTHMSEDMPRQLGNVEVETAEDGKIVEF